MTVRSVGRSSNSSHWNPAADALWRNRVESIDDTHPTSIVLRHPGTPYAEVIPDTTEAVLFEVGRRYVERANERANLGIPPAWIAALRDPENPRSTFGWSRIWARDDTGEAGRGASFWMERGGGRVKIDRTLVLIAGVRWGDKFVNYGFGIRIVAHVQKSARKVPFDPRHRTSCFTSLWPVCVVGAGKFAACAKLPRRSIPNLTKRAHGWPVRSGWRRFARVQRDTIRHGSPRTN